MLRRSIVTWLTILIAAIANGALREGVLKPRLGEALAPPVSALLLTAVVVLTTWLAIRWIGPSTPRDGWTIGAVWLTLTVAFEFLAGHYVFGVPWSVLLDDYRLLEGRLWILVVAATLLAPVVMNPKRRRTVTPRS